MKTQPMIFWLLSDRIQDNSGISTIQTAQIKAKSMTIIDEYCPDSKK